jgi:hypothetical protein
MTDHSMEPVTTSHQPVFDQGEVDVVVDLEECARERRRPPHTKKGYKVKINGELFVILSRTITGREILEIAGLVPPEKYTLRVKISGERPRKVGLDDEIDLTEPGIEKFKALPRDQTEG